MPELKRSPDFRWHYVNHFGLQVNEAEVMLTIGLAEDISAPKDSALELAGLVLTPRSAKLLSQTISKVLEQWELANNRKIELSDEKLAEIDEAIESGKRLPTPPPG